MLPSLPVALHRKFNIGLFGVSKDSFHWSFGLRTKTNISCRGQEQRTRPHYLATLILPLPWTLSCIVCSLVPGWYPVALNFFLFFFARSQTRSTPDYKTQVLRFLEFSGQLSCTLSWHLNLPMILTRNQVSFQSHNVVYIDSHSRQRELYSVISGKSNEIYEAMARG